MRAISALFCIMTGWLSAEAIIVSVDRADYQPSQKHASIPGNGWRPVTEYDDINMKVPSSRKAQRFAASLHPVIGKLQEHLRLSDTLEPLNRNKPPGFASPEILGSFSVFGRETAKTRVDPKLNIRLLPSETQKYSFLLSPNRDLSHSPDTQYISNTPSPDIRDPSFYSNGPIYAPLASPLVTNRPFVYTYNVQQTLQPPDRPTAAYEYKNSNSPYLVPPGVDYTRDFGKNQSSQQYNNQNSHSPDFQPLDTDSSNLFRNVKYSHPYHVTYERNPDYLIQKSHEVGYLTPSFEMKFKPFYENELMPPGLYASTSPPMNINYLQPLPINVNNESHSEDAVRKLKNGPTYNDVNRENRLQKYKKEFFNDTRNSHLHKHDLYSVYMPPETQQYFRQTIKQIEYTTEKEYETPESISLKHHNDQIARLAIQRNRQRFRDHEQIRHQELPSQQYKESNRQQKGQEYIDKQQMLKAEEGRSSTSESNKLQVPGEYQLQRSRSAQLAISGHPSAVTRGKTVEHLAVTVSEEPTVSRHTTSTHQPIIYHQAAQSPEEKKYESPQEYWEQNVQYPVESFSSTRIPEAQRYSQEHFYNGELQTVSLYPESVTTGISIHSAEITMGVTDEPVYPIISPKRITALPTNRTRNHRTSGKRRRLPTVDTKEPRNALSEAKQESSEKENSSPDFIHRNQAKAQQKKYQKLVVERETSSRRHPEVRVRINKDVLDVQTSTVNPAIFEARTEGPVVDVTEYLNFHQETTTKSTESVVKNFEIEYVTEPVKPSRMNNFEYVTEPLKPVSINNYDHVTELTKSSGKKDNNEFQNTEYIMTSRPVTSTSSSTTIKELESLTTAAPTFSTTKSTYRVRLSRFGNTSRPRFSVKEYKRRLDYKNRISHSSTTEVGIDTPVEQRPTVDHNKEQQSESAVRETTGKYKYMSRVSYRTSSTTPDSEDRANSASTDNTRNKSNKFSPKRRPNNSYLHRSRTTNETSNSIKQEDEDSPTIRPGNVFSPSIRHRPSVMRNKFRSSKKSTKNDTKIAINETNFHSHPTSQFQSIENQVNGIPEEINVTLFANERSQELDEIFEIQEKVSMKEKPEPDSLKVKSEITLSNDSLTASTDQSDEALFEKASQSVADLTSSASALYDKPGLFRAVSPPTENRIISTHLKITTGEPTLPIEAFFHNLAEQVR